ncbi:major facilitator superfamily domain-containing protein [Limtongia smithiae]|uniref:major facilitator superfamily domain-containing protein n=1 Tax=Limtongia smithiae TaxID=1125753 RepID=UPI0034CDF277
MDVTTDDMAIDVLRSVYKAAPGTEILMDEGEPGKTAKLLHKYQHVLHGDSRILLVPQPSLTDENDPLRWPRWLKWAVLLNGILYAFNGAMTGPIMAAGMENLSEVFGVSFAKLSYANGATLICQGVGNVLWIPFAVKYGRRPVYLTSNVLTGIACIWLAIASKKTYTLFLLGRTFLGFWEAPIESIVPSTITDIFYLHERGQMVSWYGLSVLGGNEIGPLVSAFVIQYLSMTWAFYIVTISIGVSLIGMIFIMPETMFTGYRAVITPVEDEEQEEKDREATSSANNDVTQTEHPQPLDVIDEKLNYDHREETGSHIIPKKSYLYNLRPIVTVNHDVSLWKAFRRPFVLWLYPTVLWPSVVYGMSLGWNVLLGVIVAQLFSAAPYNFTSADQGLVFISPFIGSLTGTYICGPIADRVSIWYTERNHGIREPEMRLPSCLIAAVFTFSGALISSLTYTHKTHWAGPVIGFGVMAVGQQMGATIAMSYALECHRELSAELMVTISCLKSLVAWTWTWCGNDWLTSGGLIQMYMVITAINAVVYSGYLIFMYKGKTIRLWIRDRDFLTKFNV